VEQQVSTRRAIKFLVSAMPLVIVASLLYAALFIKPKPLGASVAKPIFERGDSFYGITIPSAKTLWAAGTNGKVVRSDDAGKSWTLQKTPTHVTLQDIAAWDAQNGVAVGNDGVVITTRDGGKSWATVSAPRSTIANKLVRVKTLPDGDAWAVGEGGVVLHSSDSAATWSLAVKEEDAAWNDIFFLDHQGWLVGEFGRIRASKDNGASWQAVNSPVKVSLMAVAFRDKSNGVAVGLAGAVLATHDGGERWQVQKAPTVEHLFDVTWDGEKWMAVGDNGVVLTAGAPATDWKPAQSTSQGRGWHTRIRHEDGKDYLAGTALTLLENGALKTLSR